MVFLTIPPPLKDIAKEVLKITLVELARRIHKEFFESKPK